MKLLGGHFPEDVSVSTFDGAGSEAAGQQVDPLKPGKGSSVEDASSAAAAMQQAVQNGRQAVSGPDVPDPGMAPRSLANANSIRPLCMQLYVWLMCGTNGLHAAGGMSPSHSGRPNGVGGVSPSRSETHSRGLGTSARNTPDLTIGELHASAQVTSVCMPQMHGPAQTNPINNPAPSTSELRRLRAHAD